MSVIFWILMTIVIDVHLGQPKIAEATTCCLTKKVDGITYTLISHRDTSSYNCLTDCVYKTSKLGSLYCFGSGTEESECITTTTTTATTTTSMPDTNTKTATVTTTTSTSTTNTTSTTTTTTSALTIDVTLGILITGGNGAEVFLPGTGKICALANLPEERYGHTLDTVDTSTAVLCGGTSCLQFSPTTGTWTSYATTLEKRYDHTSWVSPGGLVLMGGQYSDTTTEIVKGGMNFTLVENTRWACSIQAGDSTIITGGQYTPTVVSRYKLQGHVEDLPSLSRGRDSHGCGAYQNGDDMILVVAGGYDVILNSGYESLLSSTEVHIIGSSAWTTGQPLPRVMNGMASVSLDQEVIFIGGYEGPGQFRSQILSYSGGSWTEVGQLGNTYMEMLPPRYW